MLCSCDYFDHWDCNRISLITRTPHNLSDIALNCRRLQVVLLLWDERVLNRERARERERERQQKQHWSSTHLFKVVWNQQLELCDSFSAWALLIVSVSVREQVSCTPHTGLISRLWVGGGKQKAVHTVHPPVQSTMKDGWMDGWMIKW